MREAFWSPYKKLVKVIEDNVTKRAQAADDAATRRSRKPATIAHADERSAGEVGAATAANGRRRRPTPVAKKIDLGTVAAIGVAIGGIGTLVGALLGTMFGLGKWLPLGIIALLLLISGPSMLLAWLKLRRRNLGPILDANGWAINSRARINVSFGAAMTELAEDPEGQQAPARRSVRRQDAAVAPLLRDGRRARRARRHVVRRPPRRPVAREHSLGERARQERAGVQDASASAYFCADAVFEVTALPCLSSNLSEMVCGLPS